MSCNITCSSLKEFLNLKTLYYDKIDFNTIKVAWGILNSHIKLPYVIHIIGTNGKGSTGRFLAQYLYKSGYSVLHYSSPHILEFNERIWIDGNNVEDINLDIAHNKLQNILPKDIAKKLTYFEYTTLIALVLSSSKDYLVLEAGLGGEFDATNVVKNNLSLITPIDFDHQQFLGDTIEKIATTKLKACDNFMILAEQNHNEVYSIAQNYNHQKAKEFDTSSINGLSSYLHKNLDLVLSALEYMNIPIKLKLFKDISFFGRFQKISSNITIDVGHNPLAAKVIYEELKKENKKVSLIYNSFEDKDYDTILTILKPVVNEVLIIEYDDKRVVLKQNLLEICNRLQLEAKDFTKLDGSKEYLVFGSFLVVENFLKIYKNI